MKKEVSIIGLGSMGAAIAFNLKKNTKFLVMISKSIIIQNLLKTLYL